MNLDLYIFEQINHLAKQNMYLDALGIFFARYLEYFLIFALLLFLVRGFKKYWPMVVQSFAAAVLSRLVITEIIRWLLPRSRPFVANHINLLFNYNAAEPSFPSGHAAFYFAIALIVCFYNKRAGIVFFIAASLIAVARVFSGIHWPSDILVGAAIGVFSGWLIIIFSRKFFPGESKRSPQLP
jgi:undecaprenyl-diphosphatase